MEPDSIVQLVGSGNVSTVENEWMKVVETADVSLAKLATYHVVLAELKRVDRDSVAAELAWAAIESLSERSDPAAILTVAGPFLLAVGNHEELRAQVTDLYRAAYAGREGLEGLLTEAGLAAGRPVRRALRTLEVCLALSEGSYLTARDDDRAARVDAMDPSIWEFTLTVGSSSQTLGPVELADAFQPAAPTEFRVMRHFAADELVKHMRTDPASVVTDICRQHGDKIDSDVLELRLVPDLLSEDEWKKWWPRARSALKKCPNITLTGRSPYAISYHDVAIAPEDAFLCEFETQRDLNKRFALVGKYLRECKSRCTDPSVDALRRCYDFFRNRAEQQSKKRAAAAGQHWMMAAWVGEAAGIEEALSRATDYVRNSSDLSKLFRHIEPEELFDVACRCLTQARPDDWQDQLLTLLPMFPLTACDQAARRLVEAGRTADDLAVVVEQILASPVACFEGLLWLWDGPTDEAMIGYTQPVKILTRILATLEVARLSDDVPHAIHRTISARARAVLPARKYERFLKCLDALEPSMARTLRRQITRGEGLGLRVRDDLVREIDRRVPPVGAAAEPEPWERDDTLFVTRKGLAKKEGEITHHVNVKMAENARAIGRAAEHGDLSENSEFKFALEERDLLRARLAQMNNEVALARVVSPDEVPTDHIGVGTKAVFRRLSDGEQYDMTFAGPWEANLEEGWFNYKAPLSQTLMGKCVGDVVEFDHSGIVGRYQIVSLHNALAE